MSEIKKPVASRVPKDKTKAQSSYPETFRDYEKLMQHDAHKRVRGRVRQIKWEERS